MSESLAPGCIFAGCRLEDVAGRGGMGVVFRATQFTLQRPVALKAIAPEYAADTDYRERFQRESHLAASIDHPNVIPVYEAGELDGTLYLIMRWIDGTDLRALLKTSGRRSPGQAIRLLRPVALALRAAHRHGLVHRDVKPANVLIARGYEEYEDHIYLTDFGIARRSGGETLTRTGVFVGTVDYMAPERIEGGRGDAPCDIYSFGCMLFEALTGHVPFDRETDVSKIFAHVNDPIPSARDEVEGVPEQLDAIIARAMAKRPEDRFASAGALTAALGQALQQLDTAERTIVSPPAQTVASEPAQTAGDPTAVSEPAAWVSEPTAATSVPSAPVSEPAPVSEVTAPTAANARHAAARTEMAAAGAEATAPETEATAPRTEPNVATPKPAIVIPPPTTPPAGRPTAGPRPRRSRILWLVPIAVLVVAGVLIAVLSGGSSPASSTAVTINGSGLTEGRVVRLPGAPGAVSVGTKNLWISVPGRNELVCSDLTTGDQNTFAAAGNPTAIAAGSSALWVAEPALHRLAQFNGTSGAHVHSASLPGAPVAIALDQQDSTAWVADSSAAISHIALGGALVGTPAHSDPPAMSIDLGEGWVWGANGADKGLVRVSRGTDGSSTAFATDPGPVSVALANGVWTAHSNGHLTRFNPLLDQLRVVANIAVAPELDAVAAEESSPFVWAISASTRMLYRVTTTGNPVVTGTVVFGSPPVALAVRGNSVWVATQAAEVVQIRF